MKYRCVKPSCRRVYDYTVFSCFTCGSDVFAVTVPPGRQLWEILVPTIRNDGTPYRLRYHKVWDAKVREISGGLTIMPVAKGQWIHQGALFTERMIPVRILATREEMISIVDMTLKYYDQIAVMAYKISEEVILKYA